jgi:hypothetical protein
MALFCIQVTKHQKFFEVLMSISAKLKLGVLAAVISTLSFSAAAKG